MQRLPLCVRNVVFRAILLLLLPVLVVDCTQRECRRAWRNMALVRLILGDLDRWTSEWRRGV